MFFNKYKTSIEEEISKNILKYFSPKDIKFHSGGREDIDVRMLGKGRPFILELVSPKRNKLINSEFLLDLEKKINENIYLNVKNLRNETVKIFDTIRISEQEKIKAYLCLVKTNIIISDDKINEINSMNDLIVKQKTPLRVVHRRTLMIRDKIIHKLKIIKINNYFYKVLVLSSAGTYIKEFIHGDFERTLPNFGILIEGKSDILQLDVIDLYEKINEDSLNKFNNIL